MRDILKNRTLTNVSLLAISLLLAGCDNKEDAGENSVHAPAPAQKQTQSKTVEEKAKVPDDAEFQAVDTNLKCLSLYKNTSGKSPDENYAFLIAPQELMQKKEHFERVDFINTLRDKIKALSSDNVGDYFTLTLTSNRTKPNYVFITQYIEAGDEHSDHPKGVPGFQFFMGDSDKQFIFNQDHGYAENTNCAIDLRNTDKIRFIPATDEKLARTVSKYVGSGNLSIRYFLKATGFDYADNNGQPNVIPQPVVKADVIKVQLLEADGSVLTQVGLD